jgi:Phage stabilisation protein
MKIGLVGQSYQEEALPFDAQRTINLYPIFAPNAKEPSALMGTPGLSLFGETGLGPGRRIFTSFNGRCFVVSGSALYEIDSGGTLTKRGDLLQSEGNISMAENPLQLALCDGEKLFIFTYSDNTFVKVTDADLPTSVGYVTFIDGYFVVPENQSGRFFISAINDGKAWDASDFATAESSPDRLLATISAVGQLWLFGEDTIEIWNNTGASDFPFRRITGSQINTGVAAVHSLKEIEGSLFWIGRDERGNGIVYRTQGFQPSRISTKAIELYLQRQGDLTNIRSFSYQSNGHTFYCLTGGNMQTTLCYDITTQQWHERAYLNNGVFEQHLAYDVAFAFEFHICLDRRNGKVYKLDNNVYDDAGEPLVAERIFTHLSDENRRIRYNRLEIAVEAGVGLNEGQGENPEIILLLSKDGARTWSEEFRASIGKMGKYRTQASFRRLGIAETITFRVRISDPVKRAFIGAYLT